MNSEKQYVPSDAEMKKAEGMASPLQKLASEFKAKNPNFDNDIHIVPPPYIDEFIDEEMVRVDENEQAIVDKKREERLGKEKKKGIERMGVFDTMDDAQKGLVKKTIVDGLRRLLLSGAGGYETERMGNSRKRNGVFNYLKYGPVSYFEAIDYSEGDDKKTSSLEHYGVKGIEDYKIHFYYVTDDLDNDSVRRAVGGECIRDNNGGQLFEHGEIGFDDLEKVGVEGIAELRNSSEDSEADLGMIFYLIKNLITKEKIAAAIKLKLEELDSTSQG